MHALFPWVTTELSQKSQACQLLLGFKLRRTGCKSSYYGFIEGLSAPEPQTWKEWQWSVQNLQVWCLLCSLCTATPPLKKIGKDFFEGRGGCTQARCLPNQYQPFENVAIYLEMHGSPDLHRVYHVFEIFNGCTVICSILASKTPNERIIFVRLGVLFLTMWVLGTDLYPTGCTPSLLLISLNPATKFGLIFLFFDNLHHSSS